MSVASLASYVVGQLSISTPLEAATDMSGRPKGSPHKPTLTTVWKAKPIGCRSPNASPFKEDGTLLKLLRSKYPTLEMGDPGTSPLKPVTSRSINPKSLRSVTTSFATMTPPVAAADAAVDDQPKLMRSASDGHLWSVRKRRLRCVRDEFPSGTLPSVRNLRSKFDRVESEGERAEMPVDCKTPDEVDRSSGPEQVRKRLSRHESLKTFEGDATGRGTSWCDLTLKSVKRLLMQFESASQVSYDDGAFHESVRSAPKDPEEKCPKEGDAAERRVRTDPRPLVKDDVATMRPRAKSEPDGSFSLRLKSQKGHVSVNKLKQQFEKVSSAVDTSEEPKMELVSDEGASHSGGTDLKEKTRREGQESAQREIVVDRVVSRMYTPSVKSLRQQFEEAPSSQSHLKTAGRDAASRTHTTLKLDLRTPFQGTSRDQEPKGTGHIAKEPVPSNLVKNLLRRFETATPEECGEEDPKFTFEVEDEGTPSAPGDDGKEHPTSTSSFLDSPLSTSAWPSVHSTEGPSGEGTNGMKPTGKAPEVEKGDTEEYWINSRDEEMQKGSARRRENGEKDQKQQDEKVEEVERKRGNVEQNVRGNKVKQMKTDAQQTKRREGETTGEQVIEDKRKQIQREKETTEGELKDENKAERTQRITEETRQGQAVEKGVEKEAKKTDEKQEKNMENRQEKAVEKGVEKETKKTDEKQENNMENRQEKTIEGKSEKRMEGGRSEKEETKKENLGQGTGKENEEEEAEEEKIERARSDHQQCYDEAIRKAEKHVKEREDIDTKKSDVFEATGHHSNVENCEQERKTEMAEASDELSSESSDGKVSKLIDRFTNLNEVVFDGDQREAGDVLQLCSEDERRLSDVSALVGMFGNMNLRRETTPPPVEEVDEPQAPVPTVSTKSFPGKVRTLRVEELRYFEQTGEPFVRSQSLRVKKMEPPQPFSQPRFGSLREKKAKGASNSSAEGRLKSIPANCRRLRPDELRFFGMNNPYSIKEARKTKEKKGSEDSGRRSEKQFFRVASQGDPEEGDGLPGQEKGDSAYYYDSDDIMRGSDEEELLSGEEPEGICIELACCEDDDSHQPHYTTDDEELAMRYDGPKKGIMAVECDEVGTERFLVFTSHYTKEKENEEDTIRENGISEDGGSTDVDSLNFEENHFSEDLDPQSSSEDRREEDDTEEHRDSDSEQSEGTEPVNSKTDQVGTLAFGELENGDGIDHVGDTDINMIKPGKTRENRTISSQAETFGSSAIEGASKKDDKRSDGEVTARVQECATAESDVADCESSGCEEQMEIEISLTVAWEEREEPRDEEVREERVDKTIQADENTDQENADYRESNGQNTDDKLEDIAVRLIMEENIREAQENIGSSTSKEEASPDEETSSDDDLGLVDEDTRLEAPELPSLVEPLEASGARSQAHVALQCWSGSTGRDGDGGEEKTSQEPIGNGANCYLERWDGAGSRSWLAKEEEAPEVSPGTSDFLSEKEFVKLCFLAALSSGAAYFMCNFALPV